jgi:hypothetical protein
MLENPSSIRILKQVNQYYYELKSYIADADQWLNNTNEQVRKIKIRVTQIFTFFSMICKDTRRRTVDDSFAGEKNEEDEDNFIDASQLNVDPNISLWGGNESPDQGIDTS